MKFSFLKLLFATLLITILPFVIGLKLDGLLGLQSHEYESYIRVILLSLICFFFINKYKMITLEPLESINSKEIVYGFIIIFGLLLFNIITFLPLNIAKLIAIYKYPPKFDYLFLIAITIIPILEELFYRKISFELLTKKFNNIKIVLLSSVMFVVAHLFATHASLLSVFVGGIVLGIIYLKSRNLVFVIVLHIFINILNFPLVYLLGYLYEYYFQTPLLFYTSYIFLLLTGISLVVFGLYYLKREHKKY